MQMSIIDEHGKPFKPSVTDEILKVAQKQSILAECEKSKLSEVLAISELRRSCGVNDTFTFKRYKPYVSDNK